MVEYEYVRTRRSDVRPINASQVPIVRFFMRWATRLNVAVFRASEGRLMNKFLGGLPSLCSYYHGCQIRNNPAHRPNPSATWQQQGAGRLPGRYGKEPRLVPQYCGPTRNTDHGRRGG